MIGRIAAAGFLLLAAANPAAADAESEGLIREFVAWVDSSNEWSASVSVVRSDGSDTLAEGLVFERATPRISISMEELRLTDLKPGAEGGFTASEIEMTGGAVLGDEFETAIPSAGLWNVAMPSLAGVTIDPKRMMTSIARFYTLAAKGSLEEASIPEVKLTSRAPVDGTSPVESEIVYNGISISGMEQGLIARQEIGPVSVKSSTPGEEMNFTIEKVEVDRIDIGGFARIMDPAAYRDGRGDNIWRPLISRVLYNGISGSGPDGATFKLEEAAVENVDGRQPEEPFTDSWDRLMDPDLPEEMKNDLALEAVTTMFAAWRVGTIRFNDISVDAPKDAVSLSLRNFSVTGWSNAGLDSLLIDGVEAQSPDGFFSMRALELAGFISPDLKALVKFAALENDVPIEEHAKALKETFAAMPRLAHFAVRDLVGGKSQAESASLGELSIDFRDWNAIYAGSTDIRVADLSVPRRLLELDEQTTEIFDTLGYDNLVLGASLSDRWNPDTGTDDATWTFSLKDAADLEFSYSLTGITLDWLVRATAEAGKSEDPNAALMAMLNDIGVARAQLTVTDRSLLERAFGVAAAKQGLAIDGAAYRDQMRAALPFIISAAMPAEVAKLLTEPLQKFLAGGQRLLADVAPSAPLRLADLMQGAADPMVLPGLLNLTLKAEPPAQ